MIGDVGQMFVLDDMLGQRVRVTLGACADFEGTVIGQESESRFLIQVDLRGQKGIFLVCEIANLEKTE